jgi:hypothetical protein
MRATKHPSNEQLRRIQRCWFRALVVLVVVGVWLGPAGLGKSRWELAAFLAAFVAASVPMVARALRPSIRLADSMNQLRRPSRRRSLPSEGRDNKL